MLFGFGELMERKKEKDLTPERSVGVYTHARLYLCSPAMSVFTACVSALGCPLPVILFASAFCVGTFRKNFNDPGSCSSVFS